MTGGAGAAGYPVRASALYCAGDHFAPGGYRCGRWERIVIQHLLFVYGMNLTRAGQLVADLSEDQMAERPPGMVIHPAWSLGHLGATSDGLAGMLGLPSTFPDEWRDGARMGGLPSTDAADFPAKEQLLEQLREQHERVAAAMAEADAEQLRQPAPERMRARFPTVGDFAVAMMTTHEANHLGQVAAWRRAMGLEPA